MSVPISEVSWLQDIQHGIWDKNFILYFHLGVHTSAVPVDSALHTDILAHQLAEYQLHVHVCLCWILWDWIKSAAFLLWIYMYACTGLYTAVK